MEKFNIDIIGIYPPPIGGVSIHIKRLVSMLDKEKMNYILYNFSKESEIDTGGYNIENVKNRKLWILKYLFKHKKGIIHYHEKNWKLLYILCIIAHLHKSKLIFTLHSFREDLNGMNILDKIIFKYCLKKVDQFIAVSDNEKNKLINYGCDKKKIRVIPAYINPQISYKDRISIGDSINKFIEKNNFNILANGSKITFYNGQDLYGLDMCIELMGELNKVYKDYKIGFIFCLPEIGDCEYYKKMNKRIKELGLEEKFMIINKKMEIYPIIKKCNLFIRPTNTDGDAISIREALYYKVPVIASDVVKRPKECLLFSNRDNKDLLDKVEKIIDNYDIYKKRIEDRELEDNFKNVLDAYFENLGLC